MRATNSAKRRELKEAQPRKYIFRTVHCQDYTVQRGSSAKPDARMPHWKPEPRERQGGLTALHIAACAGREEVVEMLLQEGEDLYQESQHGCQAKSPHIPTSSRAQTGGPNICKQPDSFGLRACDLAEDLRSRGKVFVHKQHVAAPQEQVILAVPTNLSQRLRVLQRLGGPEEMLVDSL